MCIGEPALLRSRKGIAGLAEIDGQDVLVDLSLVPDAEPGTWLLCFLGAARAVIEEDEAMSIRAAVGALRRVMAGGSIGDAFADLDQREPTLPAHLQAALDAGHIQG